MRLFRGPALFLLSISALFGCASDEPAAREAAAPVTTTTTTTIAIETTSTAARPEAPDTSTAATTPPALAFNGRSVPIAPDSPEQTTELLAQVHAGLRDDALDPVAHADFGHQEQVLIRTLTRNPEWVDEVLASSAPEVARVLELHLSARRELSSLHTAPPLESIPAWEIIEPEPLEVLIGHYRAAEEATGIEWEILAGINLIETGFGRIDGLSSAGAQGPMQFLPTTWEEVAEGGDIDDPGDAIAGAARYLVRRGALDDIRAGLWGYNNSDNYVNAVLTYAELVREDERALRGIYNWEIYVGTEAGTLWLPVGFRAEEPLSAIDYAEENPWAETIRSAG